jgi:hypothetical protein
MKAWTWTIVAYDLANDSQPLGSFAIAPAFCRTEESAKQEAGRIAAARWPGKRLDLHVMWG